MQNGLFVAKLKKNVLCIACCFFLNDNLYGSDITPCNKIKIHLWFTDFVKLCNEAHKNVAFI